MATSINYVAAPGRLGKAMWFLLHLNPQSREIAVLVPAKDVEGGGGGGQLALAPVLRPLGEDVEVATMGSSGPRPMTWGKVYGYLERPLAIRFQHHVPKTQLHRELWPGTWRLCPSPVVSGYLVDERRLRDPNASGLWNCSRD
jgi:hypothetical protein